MNIADMYKSKLEELTTLLASATNIPTHLKVAVENKIKTCQYFLKDRGEEAIEKGLARDDAEFFMMGMDNVMKDIKAHMAGGEILTAHLEKKRQDAEAEELRIEKAVQEEYDEAERDNE